MNKFIESFYKKYNITNLYKYDKRKYNYKYN